MRTKLWVGGVGVGIAALAFSGFWLTSSVSTAPEEPDTAPIDVADDSVVRLYAAENGLELVSVVKLRTTENARYWGFETDSAERPFCMMVYPRAVEAAGNSAVSCATSAQYERDGVGVALVGEGDTPQSDFAYVGIWVSQGAEQRIESRLESVVESSFDSSQGLVWAETTRSNFDDVVHSQLLELGSTKEAGS